MTQTLNIAIIGCGDMGKLHAEALQNLPHVKIFACYDLDAKKASSFAEKFRIANVATDPSHIFNDPTIHAVYIASTTNSHLSLFREAVKSGKHLFMEKPLALTLAEADEIFRLSKQSTAIMMTGFKFQFYTLLQKARELVPHPFMVSVQIMDDPWPVDFWANQKDKGGGNVISQGVHGTDLLRFLIGAEPESVFGVAKNFHQPTGVIDNLSATFRFENGVAGSLIVGDCGTAPKVSKFLVQIFGKQGTLTLTDRLTSLYFKPVQENEVLEFHGTEDGIFNENKIFVDLLTGNMHLYPTIYDGFMAQAMIDAAIQSSQQNQVIKINLNKI
ncbi:Gfo/Idh/MocA family oxidoreductase [candidate division KSB1 bacterium]|nr:Gfo/Idh/MocA family oxidoreductase [candidate division KSB1 bacterium]